MPFPRVPPRNKKPDDEKPADKKPKQPHTYAQQLPVDDEALVRLPTVLTVVPVGQSTWWRGIKEGRFPAGIKLGGRLTMWKAGDIRKLLARTAQGGEAA